MLTPESKAISVTFEDKIIDIGAELSKKLPAHCRYRYFVKKKLTLENGVVIHSTISAMTKPKLKKAIEDHQRNVDEGCVFANQDVDSGNWYSFTRMVISLR